jgi:hypothetical protein
MGIRVLLVLLVTGCCASLVMGQGNFSTSLHATRAGKLYWYGMANGGFQSLTSVPIDSLGCNVCHGPTNADGVAYTGTFAASCTDCHKTGVFAKDSLKESQCLGCHSRQKTESTTLGYTDVHRSLGMKCWDCHTSNDVHGSSTVLSSMLQPGGIECDCEDCHKTTGGTAPLPSHAAYDPHGGKIHCTACHAKTVTSCYSCHLESQIRGMKRSKQVLHDFVIIANRTKDNKVYPMTFQSLTHAGKTFVAFGPFTSHTIDSVGRKCVDCHVNLGGTNAAIADYNANGQIYFAKWQASDSTVQYMKKIIPMPADYQRSFKMDYIKYDGLPTDPVVASKNWSLVKSSTDGQHMFFATPLTKVQMAKLGFDTLKTTDVEYEMTIPGESQLLQNYPNPFNPSTKIGFRVSGPGSRNVRLSVCDLLGREVTVLVNEKKGAGEYTATWNAHGMASGVYLCKMRVGDVEQARKLLLLQ